MASLELDDPLAHRALQALLRAEAAVRRRLAAELEREGVSAAGFSALVVLTTAGGTLELQDAAPPPGLEQGQRHRGHGHARGARAGAAPARSQRPPLGRGGPHATRGASWSSGLFPGHADRVSRAFGALDEGEKRSLAEICRKLAA